MEVEGVGSALGEINGRTNRQDFWASEEYDPEVSFRPQRRDGDWENRKTSSLPLRPGAQSVDPNRSGGHWMENPTTEVPWGMNGARATLDLKMPKFNGNVVEFHEWANMFQALVHNSSKSVPEKIRMLKASLGESPRRLIYGFGNSESHYKAALKTLFKVFGGEELVVEAHTQEIENLPRVKPRDPQSLENLAFNLQGHLLIIQERVGPGDTLWGQIVRCVERKLDKETFNAWDQLSREIPREKKITKLSDWLLELSQRDRRYFGQSWELRTRTALTNTTALEQGCPICSGFHNTSSCDTFVSSTVGQRYDLAIKKRLCFSCLGVGHVSQDCKNRKPCEKDGCKSSHHEMFHRTRGTATNLGRSSSGLASSATNTTEAGGVVLLGIIAVTLEGPRGQIVVNALIDEGSDTSFMSERVLKRLGAREKGRSPCLFTVQLVHQLSRLETIT
ncbi:hypothetical protein TCAL_16534 [Tigriopus californicus]|uniref:CCHC-type domain-containing protein n=1 Tax=Tigriopus californicus TaxID=6832 RepID=A0A553NSZ8_TIGCA|nr:hypothetical protein TCAL_16534 [Tigriopus californicus]